MKQSRQTALRFVLVMGFANLFADMTYEGARSVTGPFLGSLGANAVVVGFTAGLGELVGYALRYFSGLITDRTGRYWVVAITGYCVNMLAVPALALAGNWSFAGGLVIAERTGRAIRKPSVDTMLSFAGKHVGSGWVFGLNEALDQIGATIGPLVMTLVLFRHESFRYGFTLLLLPALVTLVVISSARYVFPHPDHFETGSQLVSNKFPAPYWLYLSGAACVAAGFADFSLIAYHFQHTGVVGTALIPVYYAVAMVMGSMGGLLFGKLLDVVGVPILIAAMGMAAFFAPLVFLGGMWMSLLGMILWGVGIGAQGSLLRSIIADLVTRARRGTAFGLFDTAFGLAWFAGSWFMGALYERSIVALVLFSVLLQLLALPVFFAANASRKRVR